MTLAPFDYEIAFVVLLTIASMLLGSWSAFQLKMKLGHVPPLGMASWVAARRIAYLLAVVLAAGYLSAYLRGGS